METSTKTRSLASRVADAARLSFLPTYFGRDMMKVETAIFRHMSELCESYHGGLLALLRAQQWRRIHGAGERCAARDRRLWEPLQRHHERGSAGITATLFALSHLTFNYPDTDVLIERFHQLRDFAADHAESGAIFAAID